MKIVIIGGHISPALALIEALKGENILFIGRKHALEGDNALSLEYKIASERNIKFEDISAGRLQRALSRYTIISLLRLPASLIRSFKILKKFNPDVVVGFGGYVSLPVIFSAFLLRIPVVIHEQTFEAGLSNKIGAYFAKNVCISWESSRKFFPKNKTILTGNPIRSEIVSSRSEIELPGDSLPLIYFAGGSLGSRFINSLVEQNLQTLLENFRIVHQTGTSKNSEDLNRLKELKKTFSNEKRQRYLVADFFDASEVGEIMREASFVVSRSGINTVTELIYLSKPALLIPLSFSQRNEQLKNALFFKSLGLGEVLTQDKITPSEFLKIIDTMNRRIKNYKKSEEVMVSEEATSNILKVVLNAAKKDNKKIS